MIEELEKLLALLKQYWPKDMPLPRPEVLPGEYQLHIDWPDGTKTSASDITMGDAMHTLVVKIALDTNRPPVPGADWSRLLEVLEILIDAKEDSKDMSNLALVTYLDAHKEEKVEKDVHIDDPWEYRLVLRKLGCTRIHISFPYAEVKSPQAYIPRTGYMGNKGERKDRMKAARRNG